MKKRIERVHADISTILTDWSRVCKDRSLLEKKSFLDKMQSHILELNTHTKSLSTHKKIQGLLSHVLHTPQGAPVALDKTLYECARQYSHKNPQNSYLHEYLKRALSSSKGNNNFLFLSLSLIDESIKKAA